MTGAAEQQPEHRQCAGRYTRRRAAANLGYWVGYRIVRAYYQRMPDKRAAVREILEIRDPKAFLARSGWHPTDGA